MVTMATRTMDTYAVYPTPLGLTGLTGVDTGVGDIIIIILVLLLATIGVVLLLETMGVGVTIFGHVKSTTVNKDF